MPDTTYLQPVLLIVRRDQAERVRFFPGGPTVVDRRRLDRRVRQDARVPNHRRPFGQRVRTWVPDALQAERGNGGEGVIAVLAVEGLVVVVVRSRGGAAVEARADG